MGVADNHIGAVAAAGAGRVVLPGQGPQVAGENGDDANFEAAPRPGRPPGPRPVIPNVENKLKGLDLDKGTDEPGWVPWCLGGTFRRRRGRRSPC